LSIFSQWKIKWYIKLFLFSIVALFLEASAGWFFECYAHVKLWDYTKEWADWNGWICPLFYSYWVIMASVYFFVLAKPIMEFVNRTVASRWRTVISYILFAVMVLDAGHAFYGIEQIRIYVNTQKQKIPMLTHYKIWRPDKAGDFVSNVFESVKNFTNYRLKEKIMEKIDKLQ